MSDNPWLPQPPLPAPPPPESEDPARVVPVWAPGAEIGVIEPVSTVEVQGGTDESLCVMGAHGGAGTSTIAAILGGMDTGTQWPIRTGRTARTLVVARTSAYGASRAQERARQWAAGALPGVELVGLVWVADAPGRLPRELRDRVALVSGAFPMTVSVPWVGAWRNDAAPSGVAPHQIARALAVVPGYRKESR